MALSDDLQRLSTRAKEAEDRFAAAKTQARNQLEEHVRRARQNTQQAVEKLRADTAAAEAWGEGIQRSWSEHVAHVRDRIDARKARHEAKVAERYAQDADAYAEFMINFAYSAIEEAEYAVLDAALTRLDADEAAAAAPPS